ncbi:MAG TPA: type II secretion system F family protein [Methylovirgula sp.]|nr:type II secretion system F family protein [Methylovirgula sp.]
MNITVLLAALLAAFAAGGVAFVSIYPFLSGERKAVKRQAAFASGPAKRTSDKQADAAARRKQIVESLKEIETRNARKRATLDQMLTQAGLDWPLTRFLVIAASAGILLGGIVYFLDGNPYVALAAILVGGAGLPLWLLKFLAKRRLKKFTNLFPEAIDIIVRGVKAGLPLGDCLRVIATETAEPVRSEFRQIVEMQAMGLSVGEAVDRLVGRVPISETSFFSIVISIQQKSGGSLSEALANLSTVLRERKKMEGKIKALSSEARASAMIIGALPFVVGGLVYLTSPKYIELLWTTSTGQVVMGISAFWMAVGVFIMKKMVSFDF